MKIVIVEDEKLATVRLQEIIKNYDPSIEVSACLESIEDTVSYLKSHTHPDLLLLDIYLSDGLSFEIFRQVNCTRPVIFTTAYDHYVFDAFKMFSIDYILKPVSQESLAVALTKFRTLKEAFPAPDLNLLLSDWNKRDYKKRFLGRVGQRIFFVDVSDIAFFASDNKITNMVDKDGNRYTVDHTLESLSGILDPELFFRTNRSFIVNIAAIKQMKPYFNSRLKLLVKGMNAQEEIILPRERTAEFKAWAEGSTCGK
ncbi:MAG: response regulator transcription factor [Gemmatimonadaceae bacterium]|nr:response regulator transcription factor [Chitinophagaceae bacterium]